MGPKTYIATKVCGECHGEGTEWNEEGDLVDCFLCDGSGYEEEIMDVDEGCWEGKPSA